MRIRGCTAGLRSVVSCYSMLEKRELELLGFEQLGGTPDPSHEADCG